MAGAASYRQQHIKREAENAAEYERGRVAGLQGFRDNDTRLCKYHSGVADNPFSKGWMDGWWEGRRQQLAQNR
jgi:hypothetical protein